MSDLKLIDDITIFFSRDVIFLFFFHLKNMFLGYCPF